MGINTERDIEANLQIGPTDQGMVRLFIEASDAEIPMDFDPEEAEELAEDIRNEMFTFDDLIHIDDRGTQTLLKEIDKQVLVLALKTASEEVKQKFFSNISQRAAEMIREDMKVQGAVRLSDVEAAQATIVQTALQLEADGKIVIATPGSDDQFV